MTIELRAYNAQGEPLFFVQDADGRQFEEFDKVGDAFDRMESVRTAWRWDSERAGYVAADGFVRNRIASFRLGDETWTREQVAAYAVERAARKAALAAPAAAPAETAPAAEPVVVERQPARTVLRNRTRANRAASRARRATARAARAVRLAPRSLATHVIATGADAATVKGIAKALQVAAKTARAAGLKAQRVRIRRTAQGFKRHAVTAYRYTRAQVAEIAAAYKPRKAEYQAVRAQLLLAA